jgi:hypothetical protein
MLICAALAASGGVLSWLTIRHAEHVETVTRIANVPCEPPCVIEEAA